MRDGGSRCDGCDRGGWLYHHRHGTNRPKLAGHHDRAATTMTGGGQAAGGVRRCPAAWLAMSHAAPISERTQQDTVVFVLHNVAGALHPAGIPGCRTTHQHWRTACVPLPPSR